MNRIIISFLFLFSTLASKGLDPLFSQHFSAPIYLNPAFAGYDGCSRISTSYRIQWPHVSGGIHTFNHSYDQYIKKLGGGLALNYQYDNISNGVLKAHSFSGIYAPGFRLFDKKLLVSPAIEVGWARRSIDWGKVIFGDQIDPVTGTLSETSEVYSGKLYSDYIDFNAGLLISHHKFVYGVAIHHLTEPKLSLLGDSKVKLKLSFHFSYVGEISEKFKLSPSLVIIQQGVTTIFDPSISFYVYGVKAGLGFRLPQQNLTSWIFFIGYDRKTFTVGYSYDYPASARNKVNSGSHEVSLLIRLNNKDNSEKIKGVKQINF